MRSPAELLQMAPSVFDFVDARAFIREHLNYLKTSQRGFSFRKFNREIGVSAPGHIHMMLSGKIALTENLAQKLARGFALDKIEFKAFMDLALLESLDEGEVKDDLKSRVLDDRIRRKKTKLKEHQFAYFSRWYYPVIRELVGLADFRLDTKWIARRLGGKVSEKEVAQALQALFALGMIRSEGSLVVQSESVVETEDLIPSSELVSEFLVAMMDQAQQAQRGVATSLREMSGVTLTVDSEDFEQIKRELTEFRHSLFRRFGQVKPSHDQVYQVNLQLFPLTTSTDSKD
jgi:uncharacterized protein (TIGR02147 family)